MIGALCHCLSWGPLKNGSIKGAKINFGPPKNSSFFTFKRRMPPSSTWLCMFPAIFTTAISKIDAYWKTKDSYIFMFNSEFSEDFWPIYISNLQLFWPTLFFVKIPVLFHFLFHFLKIECIPDYKNSSHKATI